MNTLRIPIMHARDMESIRPFHNDERLARWAQRYFLRGHHRNPQKPRIKVTVPPPQQSHAAPARKAESPTLSLPAGAAAGNYFDHRCLRVATSQE